jgi:hypothetical protein
VRIELARLAAGQAKLPQRPRRCDAADAVAEPKRHEAAVARQRRSETSEYGRRSKTRTPASTSGGGSKTVRGSLRVTELEYQAPQRTPLPVLGHGRARLTATPTGRSSRPARVGRTGRRGDAGGSRSSRRTADSRARGTAHGEGGPSPRRPPPPPRSPSGRGGARPSTGRARSRALAERRSPARRSADRHPHRDRGRARPGGFRRHERDPQRATET